MEKNLECCVVQCEKPLDRDYWDAQYLANNTNWDLGQVSPPLKSYFDTLKRKDLKILIPGAGNAYEAEYLLQLGFTDITVLDFAPAVVESVKKRFLGNNHIKIIGEDFFSHKGTYDLIVEQTFFCALPPNLRQFYVYQMYRLLKTDGVLAGLLFDRSFEKGPPFGGSRFEYEKLFAPAFHISVLKTCSNSVAPRAYTELWCLFQKNDKVRVNLFNFEGITCGSCVTEIANQFIDQPAVISISFSTDFKKMLLVSDSDIPLETLQAVIETKPEYVLKTIEI